MRLLTIDNVSMHFSGLKAIVDLSFTIDQGEIRGLIGPNGAGKTTLFNVISGVYKPTKGSIVFKDKDISNLKPHRTARLGIVRTFQAITLFQNFSALKNVMVGCHLHSKYSYWGALLNTRATYNSEKDNEEEELAALKRELREEDEEDEEEFRDAYGTATEGRQADQIKVQASDQRSPIRRRRAARHPGPVSSRPAAPPAAAAVLPATVVGAWLHP